MKVAITADGCSFGSKLDMHFGRCKWLVVYDINNKSTEFIPNPHIELEDGVGPLLVQLVASRGVKKVISGSFGMKVKPLFDSLKIQMIVMQDPDKTIDEIIGMLQK